MQGSSYPVKHGLERKTLVVRPGAVATVVQAQSPERVILTSSRANTKSTPLTPKSINILEKMAGFPPPKN